MKSTLSNYLGESGVEMLLQELLHPGGKRLAEELERLLHVVADL